jgi:hypothetical protein
LPRVAQAAYKSAAGTPHGDVAEAATEHALALSTLRFHHAPPSPSDDERSSLADAAATALARCLPRADARSSRWRRCAKTVFDALGVVANFKLGEDAIDLAVPRIAEASRAATTNRGDRDRDRGGGGGDGDGLLREMIKVRSISHWFPYGRVGVVNAVP